MDFCPAPGEEQNRIEQNRTEQTDVDNGVETNRVCLRYKYMPREWPNFSFFLSTIGRKNYVLLWQVSASMFVIRRSFFLELPLTLEHQSTFSFFSFRFYPQRPDDAQEAPLPHGIDRCGSEIL